LIQVRDRFVERQSSEGEFARITPVANRWVSLARRCEVAHQQLGFGVFGTREVFFEDARDLGMQALALTLQRRVVCHVLHQSVLEDVCGRGRRAALEYQSRFGQLIEPAVELGFPVGCDRRDELVAEFAPDRRADLGDLFRREDRSRRAISESLKVAGMVTLRAAPV
jgi:hypothetical protein